MLYLLHAHMKLKSLYKGQEVVLHGDTFISHVVSQDDKNLYTVDRKGQQIQVGREIISTRYYDRWKVNADEVLWNSK